MKHHTILLAAIALIVAGCGGASDSTPSADQSAAATLKVPDGFDFATSQSLSVQVDMTSAPIKTYLTVCHNQISTDGSTAEPNFENCLIRTPVSNGAFQGEIQLANNVESLTATLWSFSPAGIVQSASWNRATNADSALIVSQ